MLSDVESEKKRPKNNNWIDPRRLIILVLLHQTRMIVSRPSWPLSLHRSNSFNLDSESNSSSQLNV